MASVLSTFGFAVAGLRRRVQGLEHEARRRFPLSGRTHRGEFHQRRRDFLLGHQLAVVGFPRIERQHPPVVGGQRFAVEGRLERLLRGVAAGQPAFEQLHVLRRVDRACEARQLLPAAAQQHHGRIAAHLEALAEHLAARAVGVDVDRHERARLLDEVRPREDGALHLVARRAPHGGPEEEDRLVPGARVLEGAVNVGDALRAHPLDPGLRRIRGCGRRLRRGLRCLRAGRQEGDGDEQQQGSQHGSGSGHGRGLSPSRKRAQRAATRAARAR